MDSVRTSDSRKIIFVITQVWSKARKMVLAGTPSATHVASSIYILSSGTGYVVPVHPQYNITCIIYPLTSGFF